MRDSAFPLARELLAPKLKIQAPKRRFPDGTGPQSPTGKGRWCLGADSNHRHADFQSAALPTELPRQAVCSREGGSIGEPFGGVQPSDQSSTGSSVETSSTLSGMTYPPVNQRWRSMSAQRREQKGLYLLSAGRRRQIGQGAMITDPRAETRPVPSPDRFSDGRADRDAPPAVRPAPHPPVPPVP